MGPGEHTAHRSIGLLKSAPLFWALPLGFLRRPGASRLNRVFRWAAFGASLAGTLFVLLGLAATYGADVAIRTKLAGLGSHVTVRMVERGQFICPYSQFVARVGGTPGVAAVAPFLWTDTLIAASGPDPLPATLKGVDVVAEAAATDVNRYIRDGSIADLRTTSKDDEEVPLIIGATLAKSLAVSRGEKVSVIKPGLLSSLRFPAVIQGTFDTGTWNDNDVGYTTLEWAQRLQGVAVDCSNAIAVKTNDPFTSSGVATAIKAAFGDDFEVEDWSSRAPNHKALIDLLRFVLLFLTQIIFLLALLFSWSIILVVIHEKRRDFAVLMTMGMTPRALRAAVAMIGFVVATAGVAPGVVLASIASPLLDHYRVIRLPAAANLLISYVPFHLLASDVALVSLLQIAVASFAGWWAAGDLARLKPAEVLRDE